MAESGSKASKWLKPVIRSEIGKCFRWAAWDPNSGYIVEQGQGLAKALKRLRQGLGITLGRSVMGREALVYLWDGKCHVAAITEWRSPHVSINAPLHYMSARFCVSDIRRALTIAANWVAGHPPSVLG